MIEIIQGGATSFIVRVLDVSTGDPFDFTGVEEITTCFRKLDTTDLELSIGSGITVLSAILGKIKISLTDTETADLAPVELATLELTITMPSADPFKKQKHEVYSVIESTC